MSVLLFVIIISCEIRQSFDSVTLNVINVTNRFVECGVTQNRESRQPITNGSNISRDDVTHFQHLLLQLPPLLLVVVLLLLWTSLAAALVERRRPVSSFDCTRRIKSRLLPATSDQRAACSGR